MQLTHTAHLVALPFAVATVIHTHAGLGFDQPLLGWSVAAALAVTVWIGWSHIFSPRAGLAVRALALGGCLVLAPLEGYLMYQYKGDVQDPAYVVELAQYNQARADHASRVASWDKEQADHDALRATIKRQIKEIVDNDQLTTRRGDMERLQKDLAAIGATETNPPVFTVAPPVERTAINHEWLIKTAITVGIIPVVYMLLHLFGFYRTGNELSGSGNEVSGSGNEVSGSGMSHFVPTLFPLQETLIYEVKQRSQTDIAIDVKKVMQMPVSSNFNCPVCGTASIKTRSAKKTCGNDTCKKAVKRATDNIKPVKIKSASIFSIVK